MQVNTRPKTYDVVIVGSGAGGGVAAQALKNLGFRLQPLRVEISEG
jgi:choline dehydrogenase-like flavoprotein